MPNIQSLILLLAMDPPGLWRPCLLAAAISAAVGIRFLPTLRTFQFTLWIIVAIIAGMLYPGVVLAKYPLPGGGHFFARDPWLLLIIIQLVMFGMGTQMSIEDFTGVAKQPRGVLVGIVCHFSVMPLVGYGLTKIFHFPPEIAAGVILIGSCSSGLASNVMAYIARANIALSVTVTAITTMVAPFVTPLWMKLLVGQSVPTSYVGMMMEIIKIVLVPIGAALLHDYLKHASRRGWAVVIGISLIAAAWLTAMACGGWQELTARIAPDYARAVAAGTSPDKAGATAGVLALGVFGYLLAAVLFGLLYHCLTLRLRWLDRYVPIASMFGIVYYTTVTTAAGRDGLLQVGGFLFLAAVLHNGAGYFFGYMLSRAAGLEKNSARSVAFEVGLQNGGMATGLAAQMGKLATVGLAAAIFSPWMNISGSILANYWRRKPVE